MLATARLRHSPASPSTYTLVRPTYVSASRAQKAAAIIKNRTSAPLPSLTTARAYAKKQVGKKVEEVLAKGAEQPEKTGKNKALESVIKEIETNYGKGSMIRLGKTSRDSQPEVITSGSIALDTAIGVGGLPRGRITEIFGPESSGKTTLALHVIAAAQQAGGTATFIDAEHALDAVYASKLGVDTENLYVSQPDHGEQALEIADALVRSGTMDVVVVDSVAALVPKAELEGDMGQAHVGAQARLMSQALRKITSSLAKSKTVLIFINQIRMKIGVMFGNPEVTSGGNALKFYASLRLEIRRIGSVKKGEEISGNQVVVKVAKNKLAPPFKKIQMDIDFGKGISKSGEIVDLGVQTGVLGKSGAWYTYKNENIAQGREKVKSLIEGDKALAAELEAKIREVLSKEGSKVLEVEEDAESDKPETVVE